MNKVTISISSDIQNLKEAGCCDHFIKAYYAIDNNQKAQVQMLYEHRDYLLKKIHKDQRKIDALDYLIIKQQRKEGQR